MALPPCIARAPNDVEVAAVHLAQSPSQRMIAQMAAVLYRDVHSPQSNAEVAVDAAEAIILEIDRRRRAG